MNINYIKQHCTDLSHDDTIRQKYYRKRFNSLFYIMLGVLFIGVVGMGVMAILSISHNKDYNLIGISCLLPAAFWGVICLHQYAKYDLIIIKQYYREHITQRLINGNWFQRQKEIDRIFFEIRRKSWRDFCTKYSIPHSCTAQYNIKTWLYSSIKPSRIKYLFIKDIIALIPVISFAVIDIITPDKPHLIIRYAVCIFIYILILATYHWVINIFKIIPYVKYRDLLKIIDAEIEEAPMTFEK